MSEEGERAEDLCDLSVRVDLEREKERESRVSGRVSKFWSFLRCHYHCLYRSIVPGARSLKCIWSCGPYNWIKILYNCLPKLYDVNGVKEKELDTS